MYVIAADEACVWQGMLNNNLMAVIAASHVKSTIFHGPIRGSINWRRAGSPNVLSKMISAGIPGNSLAKTPLPIVKPLPCEGVLPAVCDSLANGGRSVHPAHSNCQ
jgi:hypothetical protein